MSVDMSDRKLKKKQSFISDSATSSRSARTAHMEEKMGKGRALKATSSFITGSASTTRSARSRTIEERIAETAGKEADSSIDWDFLEEEGATAVSTGSFLATTKED